MTMVAKLQSWLRAVLRRSELEGRMEAEMRHHLEASARDLEAAGATAEEAMRRARVEFGGMEAGKEFCRESLGLRLWDELRADLRFAFRMLRRSPGVALPAIACLTIAIAANAAVFSWIEGILLRPFPLVEHQERMMALTGTEAGVAGGAGEATDISWPDFEDLERQCTSFDWLIVSRIMSATLNVGDHAAATVGSIVSANYFDALGVRPILGRGFRPEENHGRNAHPVVVISYQLWQDRFGGDPGIIGKAQLFNGMPHTIIGVAPRGFYGTFVGWAMQFWAPVSMQERFDTSGPGYKLEDRGARWIEGYARLKPGVSPARAQQEITAAGKRLERDFPEMNRGRNFKLFRLWETPFNNAGTLLPTLGIALAMVVLVLLIACANVSNLLLVKALSRRHEMTVRISIGAGRSRLIRQLLTEGLVLSLIAAACGLGAAHWCRNLLVLMLPRRGGTSMYLPAELDWRVLAAGAAVCLACTLLVALIPAFQASKVKIADVLKSEAAGVVGGAGRTWIRSSLAVAQVALTFMLLAGAGLLVKSLLAMKNADPGFRAAGVLISTMDMATPGYDNSRAMRFEDQLMERLQGIAGVQSAVFARKTPLTYRAFSSGRIATDAYRAAPDEQPTADYNEVGPGYLATLGIPLLSGREFTQQDNETAPPVAVVNQAMAARYWPRQDAVGSRLQVNGRWMRVVGIAATSKYNNLAEPLKPFFYVPLQQNFALNSDLNVRSSLGAEAMAKIVAREIHAIDAGVPAYGVISMQEQLSRAASVQRAAALLVGTFGVIAMLLATVGIYSVMSFSVSERRRELAMRMALGAKPGRVLRNVMANGFELTVGGLALGVLTALATTRLLGYLLFRVSPHDPAAFIGALAIMMMAAAGACLIPAWRASRTDPMRALRE